jgi:hypothetical protein
MVALFDQAKANALDRLRATERPFLLLIATDEGMQLCACAMGNAEDTGDTEADARVSLLWLVTRGMQALMVESERQVANIQEATE